MSDGLFNRRGLTVHGLLQLEPLAGAKLVAGNENATNVISRVNIAGSPEVQDFVRPQEFIMTTGYPFRENIEEFSEFIYKLHEQGVAGIGIKVQRFIPSIPQSIIDMANQLNFPVVEIPPSTVFSDVVRIAMEEVFYLESEHLGIIYNRLQQFTNQIAEGKDIMEVISYLEQLIGNPIIVYDLEGKIMAPLLGDLLDPAELNQLAQDIETKTGTGIRTVTVRDEDFQCYAISLTTKGSFNYIPFIACVESNYQLTEVDCLTIEKVSTVLSMELVHIATRNKIEKKYLDQFVKDLVLGDVFTDKDVEIRTNSLDVDLQDKWFQVVIMDQVDLSETYDELTYFTSNLALALNGDLLGTPLHDEFVFLVIGDTKEIVHQKLSILSKEIARFLNFKKVNTNYVLCVGGAVDTVSEIQNSYQQACKVNEIRQYYSFSRRVIHYSDLHIYRLLYLLPPGEEVEQYIDDIIGVLSQQKKSFDYVETLEAYFASNKNMRQTAEKLYIHYNTIVYRIEKMQNLLGVDFEDPEACLEIQVALKLSKIRTYD